MDRPIWTAIIASIGAAWALAYAQKPGLSGWLQTAFYGVGIAFLFWALYLALDMFLDRLPFLLDSASRAWERAVYPEIERMRIVSGMSESQIALAAGTMGTVVYTPTGSFEFRCFDNRGHPHYLPPDWLDIYLARAEAFYSSDKTFPPITYHGSDSVAQLEEEAFINFCAALGWALKREGQRALWVNGESPLTLRERYLE